MNIVKSGFSTVAGLVMRVLQLSGIRVSSFAYFENWRRPENCSCSGCENWKKVNQGVLLSDIGQDNVTCKNQYLAWKDKTEVGHSWNYALACLWIIGIAVSLASPICGLGIAAIVTTAGKNDILTQYFKGSAYTATWFVGLVDGGSAPTYAAGDTMASHAGWTENVAYSNANRVTWTGGTAAAGSIDNSASPAAFNINGTATIAGSFMVTNSTKSGTTGTLYSESNFTQGNRSVVNGDTLNCTATETAA